MAGASFVAEVSIRSPVLPFWPNYRLGHPENYLFSLSKKIFSGSKYPKIKLFNFEKGSTAGHPGNYLFSSSWKTFSGSKYQIDQGIQKHTVFYFENKITEHGSSEYSLKGKVDSWTKNAFIQKQRNIKNKESVGCPTVFLLYPIYWVDHPDIF